MKTPTLVLLTILALSVLLLGTVTYVDNSGRGSPVVQPQVVDAVPAQPYACDATQQGRMIYVDDTNDTAEAFLCFCGVDADDSSYVWLRVADPTANCF